MHVSVLCMVGIYDISAVVFVCVASEVGRWAQQKNKTMVRDLVRPQDVVDGKPVLLTYPSEALTEWTKQQVCAGTVANDAPASRACSLCHGLKG